MPDQLNIAIFASGKGSNFRAILERIKEEEIHNAQIVLVISNNSDSGALLTARENGIPAVHVSRKQFGSDGQFNEALLSLLKIHKVNFIALAGYMKKIDASIVRAYKNQIVNIHPALLPAFGGSGMFGSHVHEAVIAAKVDQSGATVHIVDEEYDRGPIVLQQSVAVANNDTPETLAAKILEVEHQLYPEALRLFAEGRVHIDGRHVTIMK